MLERIVTSLKQHGVIDIAISMDHKPWSTIHHLGHGQRWDVHIHYSLEQTFPGSAGAAKRLEWFLDESFIVFSGNIYTDLDLSSLMAAHRQGGGLLTTTLHSVEKITESTIVGLDNESRVCCLRHEPSPGEGSLGLANAGVFVVEPTILSRLPADRFIDFDRDVLSHMLTSGQPIVGYPTTNTLIDVSTPENYSKAQQLAAQHSRDKAQPNLRPRKIAPTVHNVVQHYVGTSTD